MSQPVIDTDPVSPPTWPIAAEGGRRLVTDAVGVEMSVVNGVVATRQGRSTGARSGRRIRPVA